MRVLAIRHMPREGAGTLELFLKSQGTSLEYWDIPKDPQRKVEEGRYDALVVLGGPMGVYEESQYPFIQRELEFMDQVLKHRKPVLGVCLGAQMIAKVLGARVVKGPWKEIGWYEVALCDEAARDPVFLSLFDSSATDQSRKIVVFQWHGDAFEIPHEAVKLAYSSLYPNQAFRYGAHVYALQFHIEMTEEMIQEWIKEGSLELSEVKEYIDPGSILEETPLRIEKLQESAARFYRAFFTECGFSVQSPVERR